MTHFGTFFKSSSFAHKSRSRGNMLGDIYKLVLYEISLTHWPQILHIICKLIGCTVFSLQAKMWSKNHKNATFALGQNAPGKRQNTKFSPYLPLHHPGFGFYGGIFCLEPEVELGSRVLCTQI